MESDVVILGESLVSPERRMQRDDSLPGPSAGFSWYSPSESSSRLSNARASGRRSEPERGTAAGNPAFMDTDAPPDAISGEGGHNKTFRAACECFRFGLDAEHAFEVMQKFNAEKTGEEQWSEDELTHKLADARKEVEETGEFGSRLKSSILDRKDPLPIARRFVGDLYHHQEHPTLILSNDDFYRFNGVCWELVDPGMIRQELYNFLEPFYVAVKASNETFELHPFKPTRRDVDVVIDAVDAVVRTPIQAPCWIVTPDSAPAPEDLIVARNGVFTVTDCELARVAAPTPRLFVTNCLDYSLSVDTPPPVNWLKFLNEIFDRDQQQIDLLQEWFGYCMTADTRQHKILMIVGPRRSGKGTIIRVLTRMLGAVNVCAPTLSGLSTNFGLSPLLGKSLATISDARLSGRTDQAVRDDSRGAARDRRLVRLLQPSPPAPVAGLPHAGGGVRDRKCDKIRDRDRSVHARQRSGRPTGSLRVGGREKADEFTLRTPKARPAHGERLTLRLEGHGGTRTFWAWK